MRVVFIGPCPYRRRMPLERAFSALKAGAKVDRVLNKAEVEKEVTALANVSGHIKASSSRRVRLDTNVGRNEVEQQGEVQLIPHEMMFAPAS